MRDLDKAGEPMARFIIPALLLFVPAGFLAADTATEAQDLAVLKGAHLGTDADALVNFFRARTLAEEDRPKIKTLIRDLGSGVYKEREQAAAELLRRGPSVIELLRESAAAGDLEVRRRVDLLVQRIQARDFTPDVHAAVARMLVRRKPASAVTTLLEYLPCADSERALDEVRAALAALVVRDGKVEPAIKAALADAYPIRRATAGEALVQAGADDEKPAV